MNKRFSYGVLAAAAVFLIPSLFAMDTTNLGHATMSHTHYHYFQTPEHAYTTTKTLSGITTPGGTAFVKDAITGVWTHLEMKAGGKRDGHTFEFNFDEDATMGTPTLTDAKGGVPLTVTYKHDVKPCRKPVKKHARTIKTPGGKTFVKDAQGDWTHEEIKVGGKRNAHIFAVDQETGAPSLKDDKGIDVPLTVEYEEDFGIMDEVKECFHNYIGKNASWKSRTLIGGVVAGLGVAAYKNIDVVRDAVDDTSKTAKQFFIDVVDGHGTARRKAFVGALVVSGTGVGIHRAWTGKWVGQA